MAAQDSSVRHLRTIGFAAAVVLVATPVAASTQDATGLASLHRTLDFVWVLLAAGLVLLMQVGFLLLEAGMVRSKNSINVAQKNLLDFTFSVLVFAGIGFMFAFGPGTGLGIGYDPALLMLGGVDSWGLAFFVFQVMFCGTAATIVSGAVAERMPLAAYVACSVFIAGLVYPVFVHWAWGNALGENSGAFLANAGFVDFAGSTVVHGTGAWIALAACLVIGPRIGRFDAQGRAVRFQGHSPVLATAGALLMFVGWIGFNGGSTLKASPDIAHVIANTVLAAAAGTCGGYLVAWAREGVLLPEKAFSGMLGGLVAVTAGCMVLNAPGALAIGLAGGLAAVVGISVLEKQLRIDDAVGAIGVHGVAGVVGTLGLALLAPVANLPAGNRLSQLAVQAGGAALNFVFAFGLGLVFFLALKRVIALRVDREGEIRGLNEAEHGTRLGIGHVEDAVGRLVEGRADLSLRLPVEPGDEAERMTKLFNRLMDSIQNEELARGRKADLLRAEEEAERLTALANATFEAIVISVRGRIIDGNHALEQLMGCSLDELKGTDMLGHLAEEDRERVREQLSQKESGPYELHVIHADGTRIPVEVRAREVLYRGERTRVSAMVDLRDRKKAEQHIRHLAEHDPLTDLPNRTVFSNRLAAVLADARRRGGSAAVLMIDLDRFKEINDVHGHLAGDQVIRATADRLRALVPASDTISRLGGDEFAIIQHQIAFANQAADLAHRLVHALSQPIDCGNGLTLRAGASIGIAVSPLHGEDTEIIVSRADTALYKAKNLGRNTYCLFEEGMDAALRKRRLLEADLVQAIEQEEFELYLQPRLDLRSSGIGSYEALIRWHHPEKGMISPSDFIPVAEQSGRIIAIGEWVLRRACAIIQAHPDIPCISVNVSPLQFRDKHFIETVRDVLETTGLAAGRLELEVTENVLIDDDRRALQILTALKALGVRIALDDFGTGYSSLGYLARFPFDVIKIDRSFIRAMRKTPSARSIVETIVRLGDALGMSVVAEGVEEADELRVLAEEGCNEVQGYLIGRPAPLSELQTRLDPSTIALLVAMRCAAPGADADEKTAVPALRSTAGRMRDTLTSRAPHPSRRRSVQVRGGD
ncbi:ammonium transporter, Amt family [Stappia indica]|uniref:Ammonium transporter, Amt family n=1 Tax=Stappia indica TaxID=538381 RepID=A0A285TCY8_9HYPH|nr:ammonium transporter, Amt family [Stappia indica]